MGETTSGPTVGAYARISNNFLHDMATGTWAAALLVIWVLSRRTPGVPPEAAEVLGETAMLVFWLLVAALAVVTVTGVVRLAYWRAETAQADLSAKRQALIVKHVAFVVVYGGGTWWGWTLLA